MATQVTLVALYGDKGAEFAAAIAACQRLVGEAAGVAFEPYELRQVHATIIGMERYLAPAYNANFKKHRAREAAMDFDGFLGYLRSSDFLPFDVRLCGFPRNEIPFTSRERSPYERSFSLQGGKVVMIGWPERWACEASPTGDSGAVQPKVASYPRTLDAIRRAAQRYGILHAYHQAASDVDNDLFFRIGMLNPAVDTRATADSVEHAVRELMSARPAVRLPIGLGDLRIAAYEDDRLLLSSTRTWELTDPKLTGRVIAGLFE
jgi:hypothetical protein